MSDASEMARTGLGKFVATDGPSVQVYFKEPRMRSSFVLTSLSGRNQVGLDVIGLTFDWVLTFPVQKTPRLPVLPFAFEFRPCNKPVGVRNLFVTPSRLVHHFANAATRRSRDHFIEIPRARSECWR